MSRRDDVMKNGVGCEEETERRTQLGVELYRKGWGYVTVKDGDGNPVTGAKIRLKLSRHAFIHGANIFMLGEMESDEKNGAYEKYFSRCFNGATVPIYWRDLEPEDGKPRFSAGSRPICASIFAKSTVSSPKPTA